MQLKLPSVPAYSFPKSGRDGWDNEHLPGPGQYDEDKFGELSVHTRQPRTIINKAGIHDRKEKDYMPGPADYESYRSSLSKKGQYVMSSAKRDFNLGSAGLPGPGAYETSVTSLSKQGVAAIKTGRQKDTNNEIPGPADYDTNRSSFSKRGVAVLKSQGHGDLYRKDALPGPLDYDPYSYDEKSKLKTGVKIPVSGRNPRHFDNIPGPASYETNYSSLNRKGYAVAKSSRNIFSKDNIPGPGNYETSVSSLSRRGVAKIAPPSTRGHNTSSLPGPADYDPYSKSSMTRGTKIPKSGRYDHQGDKIPGPADYDAHIAMDHLKRRNGAGYAETKAHLHSKIDPTPGPADYEVARSSLSKKGQATLPKATRDGMSAHNTPGPADYETSKIFDKDLRKGITIPHAGKGGRSDTTPGPGQYDYIPSVPDVASYLLTKHKQK